MKSFHEDRRPIYTFPSGTLVLVGASKLLESITEETSLLALALPVPELHYWCSRPRGGMLKPGLAATMGRRATFLEDQRPIYTFPSGMLSLVGASEGFWKV